MRGDHRRRLQLAKHLGTIGQGVQRIGIEDKRRFHPSRQPLQYRPCRLRMPAQARADGDTFGRVRHLRQLAQALRREGRASVSATGSVIALGRFGLQNIVQAIGNGQAHQATAHAQHRKCRQCGCARHAKPCRQRQHAPDDPLCAQASRPGAAPGRLRIYQRDANPLRGDGFRRDPDGRQHNSARECRAWVEHKPSLHHAEGDRRMGTHATPARHAACRFQAGRG